MIVVNAVLESTEERIEALQPAMAAMESSSRAEEGCLEYTFSIELTRPHRIRITEKWSTLDALIEHFEQAHMAAFREALGRYPPTASEAQFYEAQEIPSPLA